MASFTSAPPEILTLIFHALPDFKTFGALKATSRTLRTIANNNHHSIFSAIAHNLYPPEAFILLDQYRPTGICEAQHFWTTQKSGDSGFRLSGDGPLEYGDLIGVNEVECLRRDAAAVDGSVEKIVSALHAGGDKVDEDEIPTLRTAVYNFVILLCQWHLSEVIECKDVEQAEEEVDPAVLANLDNELFEDWTYDYTYASQLGVKELCAVVALEAHIDMLEGAIALISDKSEDPEDDEETAMDNDARLKRFVLCNLVDCAKVSETFFESSVKPVLHGCLNNGLWRESAGSFKILEGWRKDPIVRLDDDFNSRVFEKKLRPVYCGDGKFRMKELLTLKKDGWRKTNEVERKLFGYHHAISPWAYGGEFWEEDEEYDEDGVVGDWNETVEDDDWDDDF